MDQFLAYYGLKLTRPDKLIIQEYCMCCIHSFNFGFRPTAFGFHTLLGYHACHLFYFL